MNANQNILTTIVVTIVSAIVTLGVPAVAQDNSDSASVSTSSGPVAIPGRLLVRFHQGVGAEQSHKLFAAAGCQEVDEIPALNVKVVQLPSRANDNAQVRAFQQRPEVISAEQEMAYPPQEVTGNDPYYASQWHLAKIDAPNAWVTTVGSDAVTVAILDTGVYSAHPDLVSKVVAGWNTYDNSSDTSDVQGHGTTTAGAALACSNNGIGVASPAWGCLLMPMRVTDTSGYAYSSTVSSGLIWAADHGAKVASISFEGVATSSTVSSAAQYFMSKGGVVVVAAGNSGTFMTSADNAYMLVISGTDSTDTIASFSNTGNNIDLCAPAVSIYTTLKGGSYGSVSGTSYCAPITAGVAALVYSANPSLTGEQVSNILEQSADGLGTTGWDAQYGWGRLDAANAVAMAVATPANADTTAPTVSFSTPANSSTISGTTTVSVSASDNVGVAEVTLYLDGSLLSTFSTSPYTYAWDTTTVTDGTHTLSATALDSAGNSKTTQISVKVGNTPDTTAPVVSITSPTSGTKVKTTVSVKVNSSDNVGVVKVALYVDGVLTSTSTASPFTTSWNPKKATVGTHSLVCKAYDAAGNVGTSAAVSVVK